MIKIGPKYIWVDDWNNKDHNIVVLWYNGNIDNVTENHILYLTGQYYTDKCPSGIIDETGILPSQSKQPEFGPI